MSVMQYEAFKEKYSESLVAFAVTSGGALLHRIESPKGTWTLVLQVSPEQYCLIASGESWQPVEQVPGSKT